jgi:hypothetical protein
MSEPVTLLDAINAVREDEGKDPLHFPTYRKSLPPRLEARALPVVARGDLCGCRACGWPVYTIADQEGRYDDAMGRRPHQCAMPIPAAPIASTPPPAAKTQTTLPRTDAPRRFTGGIAL